MNIYSTAITAGTTTSTSSYSTMDASPKLDILLAEGPDSPETWALIAEIVVGGPASPAIPKVSEGGRVVFLKKRSAPAVPPLKDAAGTAGDVDDKKATKIN